MGAIWTPEAIDLKAKGTSGTMSGVGGPRATAHVTVSPSGTKGGDRDGWFWAMHEVLTGKRSEPHYLYDPVTDKLGQYFPLNRSARALAKSDFLPYSHNKVGEVNIQVEVVANTGDFTRYWTPGPNFRAMMRDIRSWGIADEFIFRTARSGTDRANVVRPNRLLTSVEGGGKWWGHCHYGDGESHWDPDIDIARFFAGAGPTKQEDEVTPQDIKDIADEVLTRTVVDVNGVDRTLGWAIGAILRDGQRQNLEIAGVSAALETVSKLQGVDASEIAGIVDKAVRDRLAQLAVVDKAV